MARGRLYEAIAADDSGTLLAHSDCHKCYGRGYTARNLKTGDWVLCSCLKKTTLPIGWIVLENGGVVRW